MNTTTRLIVTLAAVILAANLSACTGAINYQSVPPLQDGQVAMGHYTSLMTSLRQAVMGNTNMLIMSKDSLVTIAWPHPQGWAWVCLEGDMAVCNAVHRAGGRYTVMNTRDFSTLMAAAESSAGVRSRRLTWRRASPASWTA